MDTLEPQNAKGKGNGRSWERGYDALKTYNGQVYSGMAIGGSHTWNYDPGVWKETKKEPDLWEVDFEVTKRRARKAPVGGGAPIGTQYHWLVVAHQYVEKNDANTYTTHLVGIKGQRDREIELLEDAKRRVMNLPPVTFCRAEVPPPPPPPPPPVLASER